MKIKITIDSNSPTLTFLTADLIERIAKDKAKYTTFNHGEGATPVTA